MLWTSARNQCNFLSHIDVGIAVVVPVSVAAFILGAGVMAVLVAMAKAIISYKVC